MRISLNHIRKLRKRQESAFTITEVVLATVIISIGAAGLMGCFSYAFFTMQMARENQRATQIMLEKAEAVRLCSWEQVTNSGFIPPTFTDYYDPTDTNGSKGAVYNGTCDISAFPFSPGYASDMRQLTITLNWQTKGVNRTRSNITFISKDGVQNYVY